MNPILKNVFAVIAGCFIGAVLNMVIIMISGFIIPPPAGVDLTTDEGLKAAMPLFKPINFLMPFLAHALGTLAGAAFAAWRAASRKLSMSMIVGFVFLLGGIMEVMALHAPMWFNITDLAGAYLPMAYLGALLIVKGK